MPAITRRDSKGEQKIKFKLNRVKKGKSKKFKNEILKNADTINNKVEPKESMRKQQYQQYYDSIYIKFSMDLPEKTSFYIGKAKLSHFCRILSTFL